MTQNTALLIMDVQVHFLDLIPENTSLVNSINASIDAAHAVNMPVIYVVAGFRKDYIDASDSKMLAGVKQLGFNLENPQVHPLIVKQPDDIVVTKKRAGAFSGSDLLVILRALKVERLVLCGIETGGVVLTTATEAADMDYQVSVLSDCCVDRDPEVHKLLVDKVLSKYTTVFTSKEWINSISGNKV